MFYFQESQSPENQAFRQTHYPTSFSSSTSIFSKNKKFLSKGEAKD